jgi:glycosyltransferase involved in cell wall biosynthesis
MSNQRQEGVSVIICCYNSAARIRETLQALADQRFSKPLAWEIILVDNASTDNTSGIAEAIWGSCGLEVPLHMVEEMEPGLMYARNKGISAARYSIVLFCDDDNRLSSGYVEGIFDILISDEHIAACGGMGIPAFGATKPAWFDEYQEAFAVGSQAINEEGGRILNLYGAGLAVKQTALDQLRQSGFVSTLKGRTGGALSSSEDTELTYALVLMGHRLHYAPELTFFHFLPRRRLTFEYVKKIFIAFGKDGPVRNLYYSYISTRRSHRPVRNWYVHMGLCLFRFVKYFLVPPKRKGRWVYFLWNIAYFKQLLILWRQWPAFRQNVEKINLSK